MDGWAKWLSDLVGPLAVRVLASLGIGTVTFVGADSALSQMMSAAKNAFTGVGMDTLNLMAMAGFFDYMSITAGGLIGSLAWRTLKKFAMQPRAAQ